MQSIEVYLKKFENFGLKEKLVAEKTIQTIETLCGFTVEEKAITYMNGVLRINVSGPQKAEIFIKRKELQKEIEGALDVR